MQFMTNSRELRLIIDIEFAVGDRIFQLQPQLHTLLALCGQPVFINTDGSTSGTFRLV
ncbi:hypothetical protein D3C71_1526550 [compost metagenome]